MNRGVCMGMCVVVRVVEYCVEVVGLLIRFCCC